MTTGITPSPPRVLFVSKPITPPWHDGSKNLVRDVAANLAWARPTVMTTPDAPSLGGEAGAVQMDAVYTASGKFAPGLVANARVMQRLISGDPQDIWHFVFAPNSASSLAARTAMRVRRTLGWRGRVLQTVASAPREWVGVDRLIFGDSVVVLSEWMRGRLIGAGVPADKLTVIPPCAREPRRATEAEIRALRQKHGLGDAPIVLYPGDYEVSRGASTVAGAVARIYRSCPEARVVFACRAKTPRAGDARAVIERDLQRAGLDKVTRHLGEVEDMGALLSATSVVAFPVDDLYGKVDLPLVLLEAMSLGVPIVVARGGPLEALDTARFVDAGDADGLAKAVVRLLADEVEWGDVARGGREAFRKRFTPSVVAAAYDDAYRALIERRLAD